MNSEHTLSPAGAFGVTPARVQTTAVFALALSVFLVNLDQSLHFDEPYHLLAARSWATDGEMRITEGVYTRGWLYTAFRGWWFGLFGDDLVIARLPSALAVGLWVASPYLRTRRRILACRRDRQARAYGAVMTSGPESWKPTGAAVRLHMEQRRMQRDLIRMGVRS